VVSQAVSALTCPIYSVNWLNKLPGFTRSAPSLEWALWKKLPWIPEFDTKRCKSLISLEITSNFPLQQEQLGI